MSKTSASDVESTTSSRAPSTEPPALPDIDGLPMEVPEVGQSAPSPDSSFWNHNLAPNLGCLCGECGACYDTQWELMRHMDYMHPKSSRAAAIYTCWHCDRRFSKFYRVARHLATVAMEVAERRGGTASDENRCPGTENHTAGVLFRRGAVRR